MSQRTRILSWSSPKPSPRCVRSTSRAAELEDPPWLARPRVCRHPGEWIRRHRFQRSGGVAKRYRASNRFDSRQWCNALPSDGRSRACPGRHAELPAQSSKSAEDDARHCRIPCGRPAYRNRRRSSWGPSDALGSSARYCRISSLAGCKPDNIRLTSHVVAALARSAHLHSDDHGSRRRCLDRSYRRDRGTDRGGRRCGRNALHAPGQRRPLRHAQASELHLGSIGGRSPERELYRRRNSSRSCISQNGFARAKNVSRTVLVTDASAPAGCVPGRYRLGEQDADLTPDGRVVLAGTDKLAGSALRMNEGIANMVRLGGLDRFATLSANRDGINPAPA